MTAHRMDVQDGADDMREDGTPDSPLRPIRKARLAEHSGADPRRPVWVAVKGIVFDVSQNRTAYAPGQGYSCFAGKDASRALAKSSLDPKDCVSTYADLSANELRVLDDWVAYYRKRYDIVGRVEGGD